MYVRSRIKNGENYLGLHNWGGQNAARAICLQK